MSLVTPSTKEISDNIVAQIESSLGQTVSALLPKAFIRVLAKAVAGVFTVLYKYCGFIFLQLFVTTASSSETEINGKTIVPLIEWGRLIGVGDPKPGARAELLLDVNVINQVGSLAAGSQLVNNGNGYTYVVLTSVLLDASVIQVTVRAVSDQNGTGGVGAAGNLDDGSELSFVNAIANVEQITTVNSTLIAGADPEDLDTVYRQRVIDRFKNRPQGGAYADYVIWGEEASGVVNIYPYTSDCPGQIDVYVEVTPESSGNPDGIPTTPQLQAVLDLINLDEDGLATRRPAGALVNTFPISRVEVAVTVSGLTSDNLAETVENLEDALTEYFLEREPFIVGISVLPRLDRITRSGVSGVVDDIVSADGGIFSGVTITVDGVLVDIYQLKEGEKAKFAGLTLI